jgi:hypothetical protein
MHSGTVSLESKYGEGCKFIISLPFRLVENEDDVTVNTSNMLQLNHIERINVEFSDIYFNDK